MPTPATIHAAFAATAAAHPDAPFLIVPRREDREWRPEGGTWTYLQVHAEVEAIKSVYAAAHYGLGHRVALLLENRPEFFFQSLALNALGVSIVPVNPEYRLEELRYQMDHSGAEMVVGLTAYLPRLTMVAAACGRPLAVVDATAFPKALPPPTIPSRRSMPPGRAGEGALLYTSGTTGRPKGCILSNDYFLTAGAGYRDHGGRLDIRPGQERFYNPLPLFHMNHLAVTATCAILTGNALILTERFSPTRWWHEIAATGATIVHYLGVVAPMLLNQPECAEEKSHHVRFGLGAGVEPLLHETFERRFGFPLVEVWGMTETGRLFTDNVEPRMIATRAFGRPVIGHMEARVVDEADREVPVGNDGELVVRHSPEDPRRGFFSGYLDDAPSTAAAWRGGWFHSGDIVRQDASGMLFFVDRKKNIIRRSGENIAAAEVEAVLQAHDAVAQVAVIAAPDEVREEEVFACVVVMPGIVPAEKLAHELFAWANDRLAYFKTPGFILFLDRLPTTGTQKVQKTEIFMPGEDLRARPGVFDFRALKRRDGV